MKFAEHGFGAQTSNSR